MGNNIHHLSTKIFYTNLHNFTNFTYAKVDFQQFFQECHMKFLRNMGSLRAQHEILLKIHTFQSPDKLSSQSCCLVQRTVEM